MRDDHERLMERLRAADPVPTPPQPPTFDALLGDADPTAPPSTSADRGRPPLAGRAWLPRVRRPQLAFGGIAVLLIAVVVAIASLGGGNGTKLDLVAEARAALAPDGGVVHLVLRGGRVGPDGRPLPMRIDDVDGRTVGELSRRSEQWSTALPLRYLIRTDVLGPDGKPVATIENGRAEDGTSWEANSWEPRVRFGTSASLESDAADTVGGLGADPVGTVRRLLAAGKLRPNGDATVDGRRALRLTYTVPPTANGVVPGDRIDYLVDPSDYAPLGFEERVLPGVGPGGRDASAAFLYTEIAVERFERLPLDSTTRGLFVPPPRKP